VKLSYFEGIVAKTTNWRSLGVSEEERALGAKSKSPAA